MVGKEDFLLSYWGFGNFSGAFAMLNFGEGMLVGMRNTTQDANGLNVYLLQIVRYPIAKKTS